MVTFVTDLRCRRVRNRDTRAPQASHVPHASHVPQASHAAHAAAPEQEPARDPAPGRAAVAAASGRPYALLAPVALALMALLAALVLVDVMLVSDVLRSQVDAYRASDNLGHRVVGEVVCRMRPAWQQGLAAARHAWGAARGALTQQLALAPAVEESSAP